MIGLSFERIAYFMARAQARPEAGCWLWPYRHPNGYGAVYGGGRNALPKTLLAHRVAWTLWNGEIPDGMNVLHRCDMPLCWRPDHLFLGTQADNVADCVAKGRRADRTAYRPIKSLAGENNPAAKLTQEQVVEIRRDYLPGRGSPTNQPRLAERYGVSKRAIHFIVHGRHW